MSVRYTTYMLVLAAGLEMACRPGPSTLPIVAAAERGDTAELRALLASGVEVDAVDDQGATALIPAARGGRVGVLTVLLEAGGNPNRLDGRLGRNPARRGWTPLVHAVHTDQTAAVHTLLDFGADPNLPARGGDTPLVMAAGYGRTSLVELLLAHGANPALQPEQGGPTPLAAAVMGSVDIDRFTIGQCQTETVKALLAHAPQLRLGDGFWDHMAIRFARWSNCTEVLALLGQG